MIFGKLRNSPIKKANTTSPNPIPRPLVPRKRRRKNDPAPRAENIELKSVNGDVRIMNKKVIRMAGKRIEKGMI